MIMISVEDVYFSEIILIDTVNNFVQKYLRYYQFGMLFLAFLIVCFTLCISICLIRKIVVSPIVELTRVIQTGDQTIIQKFQNKINSKNEKQQKKQKKQKQNLIAKLNSKLKKNKK